MSSKPEDQSESGGFEIGFNAKDAKALQDNVRALSQMGKNIEKLIKLTINPQKTTGGQSTYSTLMKNAAEGQVRVLKDIKTRQFTSKHASEIIGQLKKINSQLGKLQPPKPNGGNPFIPPGVWEPSGGAGGSRRGGLLGALGGVFDKLRGTFGKITDVIGKAFNKLPNPVKGALGLGGATVVGAIFGKMISSSPLLQAMFKILNTSLTLIMRPIGDFFGAFFRPMFTYFLKEIAIPFFQQGKGWMRQGEIWGKAALGFFLDPGRSMVNAIVLATKDWSILGMKLNSASAIATAEKWQSDPAQVLRMEAALPKMDYDEWYQDATGIPYQQDDLARAPDPYMDIADRGNDQADAIEDATGNMEDAYEAQEDLWYEWMITQDKVNNEQIDVWKGIVDGYTWFAGGVDEGAKAINDGLAWVWEGLTGWTVVQEAYAEEMDSANSELLHDVKKLDRVLDRGTFDIGQSIWDGLSWIGDAFLDGATDFGKSIETGIGWLSDMIHGSGAELNNTISGLNYAFTTAEEAIMTSANLATGGLFNPQAASNPGGTFHVGTDASGMNYSYTSPVMSDEAAHTAAIASTGGQPLGDVTGNKFEFSPSKFGDIWRDGVKIDPTSPEGKIIQAQYQKQHENRLANQAQRKHFDSVRDLSTAAEAQAYVMAGGGEGGLKAAAYTKEHNLDLQNWEGLAELGNAGFAQNHEHVVIAKAEVASKTLNPKVNTSGYFSSMTGVGGSFSSTSPAQTGGGGASTSSGRPSGGRGGGSPGSGGGSGGGTGGSTSKGSSGSKKGGGSSAGGSGGNRGGSGGGGAGSGGSGGSGSGSGSKGSGGGKGSTSRSRKRQFGGIIDEPIIGIGLHSGDDWSLGESGHEMVTPISEYSDGRNINVLNINVGSISKEADYNKLKPLVQRWILEASSRRGVI